MAEKEYLTISQFAKAAGVSRQAVYSRLTGDLTDYCQEVDKQKRIDIRALSLFSKNKTEQVSSNLTEQLSSCCQEVDRLKAELEAVKEQRNDAEIRAAAADAERKRADAAVAQNAEKDKQIESLNQQITAKDEQLAALTNALASAQEAQTRLTESLAAEQALHAGTIQKQLTMKDEKSGGFWGRLFGKKKKDEEDGTI